MSKVFDETSAWVQRLLTYRTLEHVSDNLYLYVPLAIAAANTADCFLVSRELSLESREREKEQRERTEKREKRALELPARVLSLVLVDTPLLCLGSLVTLYRGQAQQIVNAMLNTHDAPLIESLSRELAAKSARLGTSRDLMKGVVLASVVTNLWFSLTNWYKGRTNWMRVNLRKATILGNVCLFFVLSKPVDAQIR